MEDKKDRAVALSYDMEDSAPRIIAKGEGLVARSIIEKAKESKITIYRDDRLVEELTKLKINQEIPEELYEAVAEVILYVYKLDEEKRLEYGL